MSNNSLDRVSDEKRDAARRQMESFIERNPGVDRETQALREQWSRVLSRENLPRARVDDIRDFVRSGKGGNPGNQQSFNREWNRLGDERAAQQVRDAFTYLLHGPEELSLERRLDDLLQDRVPAAMRGLKEGLLTKALAIGFQDRFIPILYVGRKLAILKALWGLEPRVATLSFGELIVYSNDLLRQLSCPPFENLEHAASFLFDKAEPEDRSLTPKASAKAGEGGSSYGPSSFRCTRCNLVKPRVQVADAARSLCVDCM